MTTRANPRHFLVGQFVDILGKAVKFPGKIAKGYGFEPRHSSAIFPKEFNRCSIQVPFECRLRPPTTGAQQTRARDRLSEKPKGDKGSALILMANQPTPLPLTTMSALSGLTGFGVG
jgi:hypothetical protein